MAAADTVLAQAKAQIGKPYVFGEDGPSTFDCSGLISYVFGFAGIHLPHNAAQQQASKNVVRVTTPMPGDLVFYGAPAHHVALYVGNGRQIAAPHSGANVQEQGVSSGASFGRVVGVGSPDGIITTGLDTAGAGLVGAALDVDKLTRQLQGTSITIAGGLFGAALIGLGMWLLVAPKAKAALKQQFDTVLG